MQTETNEPMTTERRDYLIGETIKEIVSLQHELALPGATSHEADKELTDRLVVEQDKLKYLRGLELDELTARRNHLELELDTCHPGEWAELEGLRGELDAKIARLRKEVGRG